MNLFIKIAILSVLFVLSQNTNIYARVSSFTNKGTGPLYWSAYERMHVGMHEDDWLADIKMVANKLKPFGYNMVCTDGGIEPNTPLNSNGYITKMNSTWVHDFQYYANYCRDSLGGLKLGIYINPLMVFQRAWDNPASYTIAGTTSTVKTILKSNDRYDNRSTGYVYWVDVDQDTLAKKYIKGYIKYFGNMGVKFLRIDFLSWYENGRDKQTAVLWGDGVNHGTPRYEKALGWMKEAAGDTIELSLVMPHLFNNAFTELKYGDMVRINDDCAETGWINLSNQERGVPHDWWSQYANAFDGLIYWSQYTGKNKMIMDADFLQLNYFSNDDERRSAISLMAMAGAPIAPSTLHDNTAGLDDTTIINNNLPFLTNTEILSLNTNGFVGKPIKSDVSDIYNSQRWIGMQADGSWIVGLFNRENGSQGRSIYFGIDMGINGSAAVRDLWSHTNIGSMSSYTVTVPSHGCKILKITPDNPQVKNGGFETRDIAGWTEWHPDNTSPSFGVNNSDFYTGQNKLYFWNEMPYSQSVHQVIAGLVPDYLYEVTARIKTYGSGPNTCRMEINGYYPNNYTNIDINNSWILYNTQLFRPKADGTFDLGFYINSPGGTSMQIDDVQLHCYKWGLDKLY